MRQQLRTTTKPQTVVRPYTEADVERLIGRFAETLRNALRQCSVSQNQIARDTRIPQPVLSRFISGERSLKLETIAVLLDYLGFEMRRTKPIR